MEGIITEELERIKGLNETANLTGLKVLFKNRNNITITKECLINRCKDLGIEYI